MLQLNMAMQQLLQGAEVPINEQVIGQTGVST